VIPKEFDYVAPGTLEEALAALRDGGEDAKVLAGGHSLIPLMKLRLAAPSRLVDLRNVSALDGLKRGPDSQVVIGAMVTHSKLQSLNPLEGFPLLGECAASIGDAQVRARGTIGGSLAHADPAADLPAAVLALDATLIAARPGDGGGSSDREIPAREFFVDLLTTALEPGEILTGVRVPMLSGRTGSAYVKIRNKASHYALVGAAVVLQMGEDGICSNAAIAITGAAATPFRLERAENALRGTRLEPGDINNAAGMVGEVDVNWMSDLFGSEEYRKHLAGVVTSRAIEEARGRIRN
jgi:aerobic carbon-monoxide dehydrogenase medium subunit